MIHEQVQAVLNFDAALAVGQSVEARWRHSGDRYTARATVDTLTARSLVVRLDESAWADGEAIYVAGDKITLPRFGNKNYSANNGAYPVPHGDILVEETPDATHDVAGTLDLDDATAFPPELLEPLQTVWSHTWLYTTAPADLDLAGTVLARIEGTLTSLDGAHTDTYRVVDIAPDQADAQVAAYVSGSWNVHTPAEFAELLDEPRFQDRFVPATCCTASGPEHDTANMTPAEQLATERHDPQMPRFDPDDAGWLESLDAMLAPRGAGSIPTLAVDDPVAQVLALAAQGTEAVREALESGRLRCNAARQSIFVSPRQRYGDGFAEDVVAFVRTTGSAGARLSEICAAVAQHSARAHFQANVRALVYGRVKTGVMVRRDTDGVVRYALATR